MDGLHFSLSVVLLMVSVTKLDACTVDKGHFFQIIQLEEELPIGTVMGSLHLDRPQNIRQLMVSEPNAYINLVVQHDKGRPTVASFTVAKGIDVDTGLQRLQTMAIACTTLSGVKLEIEVEFEIADMNDHFPVFVPTNRYNFSVSERALTGAQVGIVQARDGDIKNSRILYEITNNKQGKPLNDLFAVNGLSNGGAAISLRSPLDYETQKSYILHIVAKDCQVRRDCARNQKTSTALVVVNVKDADDLSPEFDQPKYQVSLSHDAQEGELVVQVTAHDQDDLNEALVFSFAGEGSEYFRIDAETGKVTVKDSSGLDPGKTFLLQVKASQKADPTKRDTASLLIAVVSSEWDKPQFTERAYVTSISEHSQVNRSVLSMALNYDQQQMPLVVEIYVTGNSSEKYFSTRHLGNNVDLVLIKAVDFEAQQQHRLRIVASNDQHSDTAEVTVHIQNENDNDPVFDQPSYSLTASYKKKGIVGKVTASDADNAKEKITYRFLQSSVSGLFSINETSGLITFSADRQSYTDKSYTLIVEAKDAGERPRSKTVVVTVLLEAFNVAAITEGLSTSSDRTGLAIIASVSVTVAILVGVVAFCISRREFRKRRMADGAGSSPAPADSTLIPLSRDRNHHSSSLGLTALVNERHENTYRNMSDLHHDENYRLMWKSATSSMTDIPETAALIEEQHSMKPENANAGSNSDSGCSSYQSRSHQRSQSDSQTPQSVESRYDSPNTPQRGFISTYLEEQRKRKSQIDQAMAMDNGFLVEAPLQFRSASNSRPVSITASTHSNYAVSNTSDYGSNTMPSESSYHSGNKARQLGDSLLPREHNSSAPALSQKQATEPADTTVIVINSRKQHRVLSKDSLSESANKKPFTTFHGDLV